mmetsp:Transcript_32440/g.100354  ORF Transcript_32440/g.100354 Transcript_32440/m.100354 type:complete len:210 (-) Transcript_32440:85-714(-)
MTSAVSANTPTAPPKTAASAFISDLDTFRWLYELASAAATSTRWCVRDTGPSGSAPSACRCCTSRARCRVDLGRRFVRSKCGVRGARTTRSGPAGGVRPARPSNVSVREGVDDGWGVVAMNDGCRGASPADGTSGLTSRKRLRTTTGRFPGPDAARPLTLALSVRGDRLGPERRACCSASACITTSKRVDFGPLLRPRATPPSVPLRRR